MTAPRIRALATSSGERSLSFLIVSLPNDSKAATAAIISTRVCLSLQASPSNDSNLKTFSLPRKSSRILDRQSCSSLALPRTKMSSMRYRSSALGPQGTRSHSSPGGWIRTFRSAPISDFTSILLARFKRSFDHPEQTKAPRIRGAAHFPYCLHTSSATNATRRHALGKQS